MPRLSGPKYDIAVRIVVNVRIHLRRLRGRHIRARARILLQKIFKIAVNCHVQMRPVIKTRSFTILSFNLKPRGSIR